MPIVPLWGVGIKGKSSNVSAQRRLNLYAESYSPADKSPYVLYNRPGLRPYALASDSFAPPYGSGPLRGMIQSTGYSYGQYLFYAQGDQLRVVTLAGVSTPLTFSPPTPVQGDDPVSMADNGFGILMVDGYNGFHVEYLAGNTFNTTLLGSGASAAFPLGADSVTFIASRFVVNDPSNPGRFYWSALNDGTTWGSLDFATAESSPDPLVAVWECRGELVLLGVASTEFWSPTSDTSVFSRIGGSGIQWGLGAKNSVAKYNDGLIFLGRNALGELQTVILRGYQAQIVSTPDLDYDINNDPDATGATAFTMTIAGHSFYVLNLSEKTWAYNLTTGEWDEWQTDDGRYAGNLGLAVGGGSYLIADYRNASVYTADDEYLLDGTTYIARQVDTSHSFHNLDRMTVWELILDIETGVGLNDGQGGNPQMMAQVSRDGGHTWGNEMWQQMGLMGQYKRQLTWNRLGNARDFVFRFRVSDPVKVVFINAALNVG
jgi:hypothetical protein